MLNLLNDLRERLGLALLIITHNAAIGGMGDRVLRMGSGRIVEEVRNARPKTPAEIAW